MATEAQKQELKDKVSELVDGKFGGDWTKAFAHYASLGGSTNLIERDELLEMLKDASIGSWLTRGAWADGIMEEFDANSDKKISWQEFESGLQRDA